MENEPEASRAAETRKENRISSADGLETTLYRMTSGIPRTELKMMVDEATECETSLLHEIDMLETALKEGTTTTPGKEDDVAAEVDNLLQSVLTPLDRYWTVSSLLGRLRDEWSLPSVLVAMEADVSTNQNLAIIQNQLSALPPNPTMQRLSQSFAKPIYTLPHENPATLLAVWKRIHNSKTSFVFKKPVRPEEAPGYAERILFPMDMSMIRKLIVARKIKTYAVLHQYIGLIAHNCVKYNGRESDYGRVAREFEAAADEIICQSVEQHIISQHPSVTSSGAPSHTAGSKVEQTKPKPKLVTSESISDGVSEDDKQKKQSITPPS